METNTAEKLLAALVILDTNLPTYKSEVGATGDDITVISQILANLTQALANGDLIDADRKVSTAIKNAVYNGDPNVKVAVYPAFAVAPLPFPDVAGGAETRYRAIKARFKTADGYTKEIGIALGFETADSGGISPDSLDAAAKLADRGSYQFEADFRKQGMTGMVFQWRIKGTEKWSDEKAAFASPVMITIAAPAVEGAAVQLEVRCRLLKGNEQVGHWSPIYLLTVSP